MTFTDILFYVLAIIMVIAGLRVITARTPVVAVLHLILTFFNASMLWMLLGAEFLSLLLIVVYVGAVMVLFLFVVMMIDNIPTHLREGLKAYLPLGFIVALVMVVELAFVFTSSFTAGSAIVLPEGYNNVLAVGTLMYQHYTYAIQVGALLLLVGMVSAIALTLRPPQYKKHTKVAEQLKVQAKDRFEMVSVPAEVEHESEPEPASEESSSTGEKA